jgi:hypothetical protein
VVTATASGVKLSGSQAMFSREILYWLLAIVSYNSDVPFQLAFVRYKGDEGQSIVNNDRVTRVAKTRQRTSDQLFTPPQSSCPNTDQRV